VLVLSLVSSILIEYQVAAAKGLVAGSFAVRRKDNSAVDYCSELHGALVPNPKDIQSFQLNDVGWILVIEKEVRSLINTSLDFTC
jgi:DNA topoisomerase VI subunit A